MISANCLIEHRIQNHVTIGPIDLVDAPPSRSDYLVNVGLQKAQ